MSTDYSPRSGGARRRRRGGRSGGPRSSSSSTRSEGSRGERRSGGGKPGFFDKLKSLLGLGKKPAPPRSEPKGERSQHPTLRRAEEVQRTERHDRHDRPERSERSDRGERAEKAPRAERAPRPRPELEEANPDAVVVPRLYVGNLSYDTAESDLFDLFSKVGSVKNVELVMDHRNNRSKGFGFVEMAELETAKKAVVELHKSEFMGRQLVVSGAKSERRAETAPEQPQQAEQPPID